MVTLFGHPVRSEALLLCGLEVVLCFVVFLLVFGAGISPVAETTAWKVTCAGLLATSVGMVSGATGLYRPDSWLRLPRLLIGAIIASLALLVVLQLAFLAGVDAAGLEKTWYWALAILAAFIAVVAVTRLALMASAMTGLLRRKIAVVHAPGTAWSAEHWISGDPYLQVALAIPADQVSRASLDPQRMRELGIWAVVADDQTRLPPAIGAGLAAARLKLFSEAEFLEYRLGRVELSRLPPDWTLSRNPQASLFEAAVRRSFDIVVSAALLLFTLPLLIVTAIAIKLDSPGPIFYRQERVGRHDRVFSLLKFRSMRVDAEAGGAPQWASKQDSRVTRVGRFIRLTRIDEIPQVLNVLRGDMAFVGPRPERPAFVRQLSEIIPHFDARACVKPGITGWAQVNYPYGASIADARMKLSYDLYYVERRSLFLDLLILISTVRVVVFQEGSR